MAFVWFGRTLVVARLGEGGQVDDDVVDHQTIGDQALGDDAYIDAEAYRGMALGCSVEQSVEERFCFGSPA